MVIPEIIENDIVAAPEKCEREMCFFFIIIIIFGVQVEREKRRRQVSLSLSSLLAHIMLIRSACRQCVTSRTIHRVHPSIHPNCEKEKNVVKKGRRLV